MDGNDPCLGVTGALLFLIGLSYGWKSIKEWQRYRMSETWAPIAAQVTASDVVENSGDENTTSTYSPAVTYTYQFMGQIYQGNLISFGSQGNTYSNKKAKKIVARYPTGSQLTVYYNPNTPSESVIERKFSIAEALFNLGLIICGAGMIYVGFIQR